MESREAREIRERRRLLFDGVADRYDRSRQGYAPEIIDWILERARVTEGGAVLEIGCGTGQLTEQLAAHPLEVTAIDLAPNSIGAARRRPGTARVRFVVTAFEDFRAEPASLDLVIAGTSFHWIDPAVGGQKAAEFLRPGGWIAVAGVSEVYEEPFLGRLEAIWATFGREARSGTSPSARSRTVAEELAAGGLFEAAQQRSHVAVTSLLPDSVYDVERTRATYLAYPERVRTRFDEALRRALGDLDAVPAGIRTTVTMAERRGSAVDAPAFGQSPSW